MRTLLNFIFFSFLTFPNYSIAQTTLSTNINEVDSKFDFNYLFTCDYKIELQSYHRSISFLNNFQKYGLSSTINSIQEINEKNKDPAGNCALKVGQISDQLIKNAILVHRDIKEGNELSYYLIKYDLNNKRLYAGAYYEGPVIPRYFYKPKAYPEDLKIASRNCPGGKVKCMEQQGWQLVIKEFHEQAVENCKGLTSTMEDDLKRKQFLICLAGKGFDEETPTEYVFLRTQNNINIICTKDVYKDILAKSPCKIKDILSENLSDATKIDESQKAQLLSYFSEYDSVQSIMDNKRKTGGMFDKKYIEYKLSTEFPAVLANRNNILSGLITWGEYNQIRKKISSDTAKVTKFINQSVTEFIKN